MKIVYAHEVPTSVGLSPMRDGKFWCFTIRIHFNENENSEAQIIAEAGLLAEEAGYYVAPIESRYPGVFVSSNDKKFDGYSFRYSETFYKKEL